MRSCAVCLLIVALIGGGMCGRLRRQAPPSGGIMGSPPEGVGPDMDGPPAAITTQDYSKAKGLDVALDIALTDLNNQAAMGVPVDTEKVNKAVQLGAIANLFMPPRPAPAAAP